MKQKNKKTIGQNNDTSAMRKLIFAAVIMAAMVMAGCQSNQKRPSAGSNDSIPSENAVADSTVYGVCGENTAMHTL